MNAPTDRSGDQSSRQRGIGVAVFAVAIVIGAFVLGERHQVGWSWYIAGGMCGAVCAVVLQLYEKRHVGSPFRFKTEFGLVGIVGLVLILRALSPPGLLVSLMLATSAVEVQYAARLMRQPSVRRVHQAGDETSDT